MIPLDRHADVLKKEKSLILLAEDNPVIGADIRKNLKELGYNVPFILSSGQEMLEKIDSLMPDLIIMDIMLEGEIDGIETVRKIQERHQVPVIYLTAHSESETLERAKKTAPYGYLIKPVKRNDLHSTIETALHRHMLEKKIKESEELHRITLSNMSEAVFITDDQGEFTFICPNVDNIFGFDYDEVKSFKNIVKLLGDNIITFHQKDNFTELRGIELNITDKWKNSHIILVNIKRVSIKTGTFLYTCHDITARKKIEGDREMLLGALEQRMKQLDCLYKISEIVENSTSLEEILQSIVNLVPSSFQYPEITCARITLSGKEYKTKNFRDSFQKLSADILVHNTKEGSIEIDYYNDNNKPVEILFLEEETKLLSAIAERLGRITERKKTEQALIISEERNKLAQRSANIGIWDWNITTGELSWSEQIEPIFGLQKDEFEKTYLSFLERVHPHDRQFVMDTVNSSIKNNENYTIEHRILWPNGTIHWVFESGDVIQNHMGEAERMLGAIWDITSRREEQEKLKKLHIAVEQNPASIAITDRDGNIEYVNPTFCETTGYTLDEVKGKNPRILKSGKQSHEFYHNLWNTILSGKVWKNDIYNKKKNGECYWERSFISPLKNEKEEITHFIATNEDITERKILEEKLYQAKISADSANQAKSEFLANMSHELRTPLNGIIGFSQLLEMELMEAPNPKQKEYISFIKESGNHLLEMVNDILDLSKIEAGKLEIERKPFDFTQMLKRSPSTVKAIARKKNIKMDTEIEPALGWLNGDEIRIKQVLFNLLSNAIKFTESGKKIGISAYAVKDSIKIIVWDEGIGIPADYIEKIFDPFEQVKNEKSSRTMGTGLGLSISKKLVELHNGTLTVESKINQGSRFVITLPERITVVSKNTVPPKPEKKNAISLPQKEIKILLVEDDELSRILMQKSLEPAGFSVSHAPGGNRAIELVSEQGFDLILMDIGLPGMDGIETLEHIRKHCSEKIPVIALTAFAMKGDMEKYLSRGFNGYISKPVNLELLIEKIEELLK
ncbi:MAG: response regulator [bacterium]|nr:response regulator [bacterium]